MTIPNAAAWLVPGQPGFNVERARWLTLTYDGVPLYQSAAFFKAMYATGTRVIRGFFGTSPSNDIIGLHRPPVASDLTPYFEGLDLATQAGIRCYFDATDVLPVTDWTNAGSWVPAWIETFAAAAAAYPFKAPALLCFGPFNEPEDDGQGGALWNPIIEAACATMRKALPNAVLSIPHNYWNSPQQSQYGTLPTAPDAGFIFPFHYYPTATPAGGDAAVQAEWAGVATEIAATGKPAALTEAGLFNANVPSSPNPGFAAWPAAIAAMYAGAGALSPLAWALTDMADANAPPLNQTASGLGTANGTGDLPAPVATAYAAVAGAKPVAPSVITVAPPGTVVAGQSVTLAVKTTPPLAEIGWVGVSGGAGNPWYGSATAFTTLPLAADGTGKIVWVPKATGDFVKFGIGVAASQDTPPATLTAAPPTPVPPASGVTKAQLAPIMADVAAAQTALATAAAALLALKPA